MCTSDWAGALPQLPYFHGAARIHGWLELALGRLAGLLSSIVSLQDSSAAAGAADRTAVDGTAAAERTLSAEREVDLKKEE